MLVLGFSAYGHENAAALLKDGRIVSAVVDKEPFPRQAITTCLKAANTNIGKIDSIVFFEKPLFKFERFLEEQMTSSPRGFNHFKTVFPDWIKRSFLLKRTILNEFQSFGDKRSIRNKMLFSDSQKSHAAASFFSSPFEDAVILTLDTMGEWASSSVSIGRGNHLEIEKEILYPHSLGSLYNAFASWIGADPESVAAQGKPLYVEQILTKLLDIKEDGSFRIHPDYMDSNGKILPMLLFREQNASRTDIAASVQQATEYICCTMVRSLAREYRHIRNLCLAGNISCNKRVQAKILQEGFFENIWVEPECGSAIGAAMAGYYLHHKKPRHIFFGQSTY